MKVNYEATLNYVTLLINNSFLEEKERLAFKDLLPIMSENDLVKLINILVLEEKEKIQGFLEIILSEYGKDENI